MTDRWTRKDAWLGLLFLITGALIVIYGVLLWQGGWTRVFLVPGFLVGPVLFLLGVNALVRSLAAGPPPEQRPPGDAEAGPDR